MKNPLTLPFLLNSNDFLFTFADILMIFKQIVNIKTYNNEK